MAGFSKEDVLDVKEVIMKWLFGEEFRDSAEGRIEGSKVESQIIKEIFGVRDMDIAKEGEGTHANPSITKEPRGPALANGSSLKDSSEEAHERAKSEETSEFESCQESSSSCAGSSAHNALVARVGLSDMKHLDREKKEPVACFQPSKVVLNVPMKDILYEPVSSTVHLDREKRGPEHGFPGSTGDPMEFNQEGVPSRVIEPLERDILFTCNLLNYQGDIDATGCTVGGLVSNYQCRVQQIEDVEVVVDGKSVASPVSQESVASVLPSTSAHLAPKKISGAIICPKQSTEEPKNLDIVDAAIVLKRPLKRELRCRLESYAHSLLRDAGWKIELRRRNGRCRPAYFFINTKERFSNKALTVAWKACGQKLLASAAEKQPDENGREWWDVDSFWRDMIETMECLDKEAHRPESSVSLLHRWQLLDPFMAIVWIDKKVGTLKAGKGLKAVKSTTFVLGESRRMILEEEMTVSRSDNNAGDLQSKGLHSVNCLHMGFTGLGSRRKRSNRSSSKSTFVQRGSDFPSSCPNENKNLCVVEETPSLGADGNCGQTNMQSEVQCTADKASQHEGNIVSSISNNLSCKSVYQGFSLVPEEGVTIAGKMMASETTKSKLKRTAAAPGDGSTKKARKKSKKISEIGAAEKISKDVNSKVRDGNCREEFAPSMDYKGDEQLDHVCCQKETTSLISELSPECLPQGELFEKQMSSVPHTSRSEDKNVSANAKIFKKSVKPETKAARQSGKGKGDLVIPQEDDQGDALSEGDIENHKSTRGDRKSRRLSSNESNSVSSKKHKVAPEFNMACDQLAEPKAAVSADNGNVPKKIVSEDIILSSASGVSPEPGSNQKPVKANNKSEHNKKKGEKKLPRCRINDDDLLISALINIKNAGFCSKKDFPKAGASQLKALRKLTNQKGRSKLIPRSHKDRDNFVDGSIGRRVMLARRTVLCWLIEMGALSLKDVIQYRHPRNSAVLKDGWVTGEGILCQCCTQIFSICEFKAHAGLKQQRPSLNLFVQSGKSFVVCQFEAWSAELKKRKSNSRVMGANEKDENDDTCGLCGDGGDLICCDNCPSTYHETCLSIKDLPEGNWYCTNCICVMCRGLANGKETSSSLAVLECAQCELKYHSACFAGKLAFQGGTRSGAWLCGESCEEVYLGLRSCVGAANYFDDGFSWTVLRCSHDDRKVCSPKKAALIADCNTKLAIGLNLMEECFQPMVDPRTGIDMIPHVLYNLGSRFTRLNYKGFYAVVLEKGDQLISVASIRLHGATVAEMPLIATCSEHRRQGMCRRLLNAIEKMLISFKVKMLVLSAIPSLVETWISGFGFKPVEDEEKQRLAKVNLMLFPGTTLLTKNLHEASARESVGNFCSTAQHSHIGGDLIESADTLFGHHPTENPRSQMDAKSLIPSTSDAEVELISIQQRERQMISSDNCVLTASLGEHGVVSNAGSYLSITTANINEMDQDFSTDQVVSCQKPVTNISVVHYCSGLFSPRATKIELPSNPSNTTHDVIIRDVQESTPQNINILTKDNATEAMNGERTILPVDEVAKKFLVDDLLDKNDHFLSDEPADKGPFLATTHDEVPNVVPIRYIEESTCQSVDILTESSAAETMDADRTMSILGGEVVRKSVVEVERKSFVNASLRNDGACISEELALRSSSLAAPNANGINMQQISNGEGPGDDASGALEGDFVGEHVVAKGCTADSLEVCHSILHDRGSGSNP